MSWRIGTVPQNYREALEAWPWLMTQLGPVEFRRQLRAAAIRAGIIDTRPVPIAERLRVAAELRAKLEGHSAPRQPRSPNVATPDDAWRAAGRCLSGAAHREWMRLSDRRSGFHSFMLSRADHVMIRRFLFVGQHQLDSDRRP